MNHSLSFILILKLAVIIGGFPFLGGLIAGAIDNRSQKTPPDGGQFFIQSTPDHTSTENKVKPFKRKAA